MRSSKAQQQQQQQYNQAEVSDVSLMNRDSFNSQLMELEMNLRNECDVLEMALNFAGTSVPNSLHTEFDRLRGKVAEQITTYQTMRGHRQSSSQLSMVKLTYNKIMLEFERIISSNPTIEETANRFPRQTQQAKQQLSQQQQQHPSQIQVQQQQNQETLRSAPQPISIQKNNINYYAPGDNSPDSSLKFSPLLPTQSQQQIGVGSIAVLSKILSKPPLTQTSFHSVNASTSHANKRQSAAQPHQSQTYLAQQGSSSSSQQILNNSSGTAAALTGEVILNAAKRESIEKSNTDFIKRELIEIKQSLQSVAKKLDTHSHSEYELEIDYLQKENNSIMHDYKILKNDNTEIMHSLRTLSAIAQEIKLQNEQMLSALDSNQRHLNQLKSFDQQQQQQREMQANNNLAFQYQSEQNTQYSQQKNIVITRQDSRNKFQHSPNQNNKSQMSNSNHSTTRYQNSNALQNSRQKHIDSIRKLDFLEQQQQQQQQQSQQQQSEYPEELAKMHSNSNNNNNNNRVITRSSTRAAAAGVNSLSSTSFPQSINLFSDNQQQQPYQPTSNKNSLRNSMPRQLIQEVKSSETEEDNELLSSWARQRI